MLVLIAPPYFKYKIACLQFLKFSLHSLFYKVCRAVESRGVYIAQKLKLFRGGQKLFRSVTPKNNQVFKAYPKFTFGEVKSN